ncbi:MAG: proline dehydrogenase family protein [Georgfuchsia sp.]
MNPGSPLNEMHGLESETCAVGQKLFSHAAARRPTLYRGIEGSLLTQAMADERLLTSLLRLIDVLPQLGDSRQVAAHLHAYIDEAGVSGSAGWLLQWAARPSLAWLVRRQSNRLAHQFLAEESTTGLTRVITHLARVPAQVALDAVGEAVLTDAEADIYRERNLRLLRIGSNPPHLSLKLTALTPRFDPLDPVGSRRRVFARLAPIVAAADASGATITVDMEQHELKPLILRLFLDMLEEWPGRWQPAIALQAYLPETAADIDLLLDAAQRRSRRLGVRLVKGAYWDQECAWAAQRHWPLPVFRSKAETDAQYERLTRYLLQHADSLHPAIASHNLRNQAVALACARRLKLAPPQWEAQMLYGMAEPLRDAVAANGVTLRIYVPVGDPAIGIAYLIRRLLENTASTSILRQSYVEGRSFETLIAPPSMTNQGKVKETAAVFTNLPLLDFSRDEERAAFQAALVGVRATLPRRHALAQPVGNYIARNPADPDDVLGSVDLAGPEHANAALASASATFPAWRDTPVAERVRLLRRTADLIVAERRSLAALEVLEAAKPWREADADVAEAVDFLRYYAVQMEHLASWRETMHFPGEDNHVAYAPRGVAVAIAPWNFPLAILAGMTSAALVTGNCTVMKPALPGLLIAHRFLELLHCAGMPDGVCQLLPGDVDIGALLVTDARVHVIAFTGSRKVGLQILQAAHTPAPGQRHVKQVVCEMGGKNAIIVDADADLDDAVSGILASAFSYSGQKCSACSRLIAVGQVHDRLLARLAEAAATLPWGPPEDPACTHGPLINAAAQKKAQDYIEIGRCEGRLVWQGNVPTRGNYVAPAIFADIRSGHRLAREEIFGPVLVVMCAPDFETAISMAMDSDYALTGGVYSRLPTHLQMARENFRVGNLYLNREITGARVGVQPFGGVNLSGIGVQAGGDDYLKQFLWSHCVASNTMRHGFIPNDKCERRSKIKGKNK